MSWSQPYPWGALVAVCAALAIWGRMSQSALLHGIFKPLTTLLIATVAFLMIPPGAARNAMLVGLGFSLAGDVALMFPSKGFVWGLGSFLVALLAYATAFTLQAPFAPRQLLYGLLPVALVGLILSTLWGHLGRYRWPVVGYISAMALMVWRALSRFDATQIQLASWVVGAVGALLFLTGDTLLARRKFLGKPAPYPLELGVYYAAQWCLVISMV